MPKDRINTRILHSGFEAQDKGDSRSHVRRILCVYLTDRRKHKIEATYYIIIPTWQLCKTTNPLSGGSLMFLCSPFRSRMDYIHVPTFWSLLSLQPSSPLLKTLPQDSKYVVFRATRVRQRPLQAAGVRACGGGTHPARKDGG